MLRNNELMIRAEAGSSAEIDRITGWRGIDHAAEWQHLQHRCEDQDQEDAIEPWWRGRSR